MAKQVMNRVTRRQNRHKSPQPLEFEDKKTRLESYNTSPILGHRSFSKSGGFSAGFGGDMGLGVGYRDRQVSREC